MSSFTAWASFVEACRLGTLSATAEFLGYTQSAVSRQIGALERDVGATLLSRETRGIRPTDAGAALLPHARLAIAEAMRGREAAREALPTRQVLIGAVPSAAQSLVPAGLRHVTGAVSWSLITGLTGDLVDRVAGGELDLAVVTNAPPGLPEPEGIAVRHLVDDRMAVVLPQEHRLARRRRVRIADFAGDRWLEDNPGSERMLRHHAARHGLPLKVDRSPGDLATKTALVAAGHGIALIPTILAPALRRDVRLVYLADAPRREIYAVTQTGRVDLQEVLGLLQDRAQGN